MFGNVDFTLFGVSWILVGSMLVALIRRYWTPPEEAVKLGAALYMVLGFLIDKSYVGETWAWPTTPEGWIGLFLQAFIYFGSIMGLAPGDTARRVYRSAKYRILGR